jgi:hypothetical protein
MSVCSPVREDEGLRPGEDLGVGGSLRQGKWRVRFGGGGANLVRYWSSIWWSHVWKSRDVWAVLRGGWKPQYVRSRKKRGFRLTPNSSGRTESRYLPSALLKRK